MPHRHNADILCDLKNERVDIGHGAGGFRDLIRHETRETAKAGKVKAFRFVDGPIGQTVG